METRYSAVLTGFILSYMIFSGDSKSASENPKRSDISWNADFTKTKDHNILQGKRKKSMKENRKVIKVKLQPNQKYHYDLGSFGDEEGAGIHRQASHFSVSEIEREPERAKYFYTPEKDYIGTDEVEIVIERGSDGASPHDDFTYIIIKFTISKK